MIPQFVHVLGKNYYNQENEPYDASIYDSNKEYYQTPQPPRDQRQVPVMEHLLKEIEGTD